MKVRLECRLLRARRPRRRLCTRRARRRGVVSRSQGAGPERSRPRSSARVPGRRAPNMDCATGADGQRARMAGSSSDSSRCVSPGSPCLQGCIVDGRGEARDSLPGPQSRRCSGGHRLPTAPAGAPAQLQLAAPRVRQRCHHHAQPIHSTHLQGQGGAGQASASSGRRGRRAAGRLQAGAKQGRACSSREAPCAPEPSFAYPAGVLGALPLKPEPLQQDEALQRRLQPRHPVCCLAALPLLRQPGVGGEPALRLSPGVGAAQALVQPTKRGWQERCRFSSRRAAAAQPSSAGGTLRPQPGALATHRRCAFWASAASSWRPSQAVASRAACRPAPAPYDRHGSWAGGAAAP